MDRLTDDELRALAFDFESPRIERKARLDLPKTKLSAQRTLCAFANDIVGIGAPGVLFIGLEDDGRPIGLDDVQAEMTRMVDFLRSSTHLHPAPIHEVRDLIVNGTICVAVVVHPHRAPPVRLNGDVWVRTGPSVRRATPGEEQLLADRERAQNPPFEGRAVQGAGLDDLDERLCERYLDRIIGEATRIENNRPLEHQLRAQRLLQKDGTPTNAGMLLFGREPTHFLPNAFISMVRFVGEDFHAADRLELRMPLVDAANALLLRLQAWNKQPMRVDGAQHQVGVAYPEVALREVAINALVHRDYQQPAPIRVKWFDDHVEFVSPGGPLFPVTPENFGEGPETAYRNPRITEAMMAFGYVERHATGLLKTRATMRRNGNPEPEFKASLTSVVVKLPAKAG